MMLKVLWIMMLARWMLECNRSGMGQLAEQVTLLASELVRLQLRDRVLVGTLSTRLYRGEALYSVHK